MTFDVKKNFVNGFAAADVCCGGDSCGRDVKENKTKLEGTRLK